MIETESLVSLDSHRSAMNIELAMKQLHSSLAIYSGLIKMESIVFFDSPNSAMNMELAIKRLLRSISNQMEFQRERSIRCQR